MLSFRNGLGGCSGNSGDAKPMKLPVPLLGIAVDVSATTLNSTAGGASRVSSATGPEVKAERDVPTSLS